MKSKGRTNGGVRRQHKGLRLHSKYKESRSKHPILCFCPSKRMKEEERGLYVVERSKES